MRSETGLQLINKAKLARAAGRHEEAQELEMEAKSYLYPADKVKTGAGNETLPQHTTGIEGYHASQIKSTLENPSQVNLDASQSRLELLQQTGILELGLDVAESIDAKNSIEKMLAHQAAACHKMALQLLIKSEEYRATGVETEKIERLNIEAQTRYINTARRLMDTFQRILTTIQKLRTGGQQTVTVQHVQVHNAGDHAQTLINRERGGGSRR